MLCAGGADGELAQDFAGGDVDDGDVEVVDEEFDVGSGCGFAPSDVASASGASAAASGWVQQFPRPPRGDGVGRSGGSFSSCPVPGYSAAISDRSAYDGGSANSSPARVRNSALS